MKAFSGFVKVFIGVAIAIGILALVIANYSWVFSKRVTGQVVDVERVTDPSAIYSAKATEQQMYSYSVLIQGDDGHLYTSSSEDRQWQVVKKGYCVEALLFRYPPWHLEKANTFFNARVKDIKICPGQSALPQNTPGATGPPGQQQNVLPPPPPPAAQ